MKLKYAKSASIAYQLDPANNPRPATLGAETTPKSTDAAAFALPDGIEQIVSVDPQNTLLIAYKEGSEQSVRDLQELIEVLDQPLRQVEIEAQFVEMSNADFKSFNFDFSEPEGQTPAIDFGFARSNFALRLSALIAKGAAKIIWAPPVTATSTLSATIISTEKEIVDGKLVTVVNDYRITPILNGDDTITVSFKITANENNVADEVGRPTIKNRRDGETIALLGVIRAQYRVGNRIAIVGAESLRPTDPDRVTVVFLTPRIVRYTGETPQQ